MEEEKQEGQVMVDHRFTANKMFEEKDLLLRFKLRMIVDNMSDFMQRKEVVKIMREEADRLEGTTGV